MEGVSSAAVCLYRSKGGVCAPACARVYECVYVCVCVLAESAETRL